jgi:hypothetical protein
MMISLPLIIGGVLSMSPETATAAKVSAWSAHAQPVPDLSLFVTRRERVFADSPTALEHFFPNTKGIGE